MNWCKFRHVVGRGSIDSQIGRYIINLSTLQFVLAPIKGHVRFLITYLTFLILHWIWGCFVAFPIQGLAFRPETNLSDRWSGLVKWMFWGEWNPCCFVGWWLGGWAIMYFQVGLKTMWKGWNVVIWPNQWWGHSSHCLSWFIHIHSSSRTCCCQSSCSRWQQQSLSQVAHRFVDIWHHFLFCLKLTSRKHANRQRPLESGSRGWWRGVFGCIGIGLP